MRNRWRLETGESSGRGDCGVGPVEFDIAVLMISVFGAMSNVTCHWGTRDYPFSTYQVRDTSPCCLHARGM